MLVFASGGNMINQVGTLPTAISGVATGISDFDYGYRTAGFPINATIERFPFASDSNGSDHGDLAQARAQPTGCQSFTYGYCLKGYGHAGTNIASNVIDKFAFASNVTGTDVGDAVNGGDSFGGCSSATYGYAHGGNLYLPSWAYHDVIQKVSFSADGNSTDVGNLIGAHGSMSGTSSETYGYLASGGPPNLNTIQKHSFATDGNATDIADLTATRRDTAGFHV
jgi:hypothetical protein